MPVHPLHRVVHAFAAVAVCMCAAATVMASDVMGPMPPTVARRSVPVPSPVSVAGHHQRPSVCPDCRGDCRGGTCPAQCPVRPDEFGFYETRWRTWPGVATVRPIDIETLTPVSPPRSEVPSVEQESRALPLTESPPADAAALPAPQPVPDRARAREPSVPPAPARETEDEQPAEPSREPAEEPVPPRERAKPTDDENLFDEATRRLPRAELMAVLMGRAAQRQALPAAEAVMPVAHAAPVTADAAETQAVARPNATRAPLDGRSRNPLR